MALQPLCVYTCLLSALCCANHRARPSPSRTARFLFINLRKRVAAFLVALEQQEARKQAAAVTATASTAAALAAPTANRSAQANKNEDQAKEQEQTEHASTGANTVAARLTLPLLHTDVQSDGAVELSECGRTDVDADACASRAATASAAQPSRLVVARTASLPSATSSSSLQLPNSPILGSSTLMLPHSTVGGSTVHVRLATSRTGSMSGQQLLAAPAPTRTPTPTLRSFASTSTAAASSTSATAAATATRAAVIAVPSFGAAAAVSQSAARLSELRGALHKLNLLTALVTVILLGTGSVQVPDLLDYFGGAALPAVVHSPTGPDDPYPLFNLASTALDQLSIIAILSATNAACAQCARSTRAAPTPVVFCACR